MRSVLRHLGVTLGCAILLAHLGICQSASVLQHSERPSPPTRDPHTAGYVTAKELPDGEVPPASIDGNFIIGVTHPAAPELPEQNESLQSRVIEFTINSSDSKIFPGIARDANTFWNARPTDPAKLIVTTSRPAPYTRKVAVYVPKQYVAGTAAPFIVGADGPGSIALLGSRRVDYRTQDSCNRCDLDRQRWRRRPGQRTWTQVHHHVGALRRVRRDEVLPLVENKAQVKLTRDPDGRAAIGYSSGGACALSMAWYHPEW